MFNISSGYTSTTTKPLNNSKPFTVTLTREIYLNRARSISVTIPVAAVVVVVVVGSASETYPFGNTCLLREPFVEKFRSWLCLPGSRD